MTLEQDGDDHSVHSEDTSHDDGDDRLEKEVWSEDSDGNNTDTGLGSSVGSAEVGEDEGRDNAHNAEEDTLVGVTKS